LVGRQVPSSELVFFDPGCRRLEIWQIDRLNPELDPMPVADVVAVMAIQQNIAPDDERRLAAMCQDVFFELPVFVRLEGGNMRAKAFVNSELHFSRTAF
jgi:hypothetical protein